MKYSILHTTAILFMVVLLVAGSGPSTEPNMAQTMIFMRQRLVHTAYPRWSHFPTGRTIAFAQGKRSIACVSVEVNPTLDPDSPLTISMDHARLCEKPEVQFWIKKAVSFRNASF